MNKKYHVLHIEDDVYIRRIIQHSLSKEHEITSCPNGCEAMVWLEKGNMPDIILTDLQMPDINGQELIRHIRNCPRYGNVPIIVLSSMHDSTLKISCFEQGADDFIVKPFSPLVVNAKINALLRRFAER